MLKLDAEQIPDSTWWRVSLFTVPSGRLAMRRLLTKEQLDLLRMGISDRVLVTDWQIIDTMRLAKVEPELDAVTT